MAGRVPAEPSSYLSERQAPGRFREVTMSTDKAKRARPKSTRETKRDQEAAHLVTEGLTHLRKSCATTSKADLAEARRWREKGAEYLRKHDIKSAETALLAIEVGFAIEKWAAQ
jgi:hypothetical protein